MRSRQILDIIGAGRTVRDVCHSSEREHGSEDICVDRRTAFGGLAGRCAATATTGAWCRRQDEQFDPSKQRPYMYRRNGCDFLQPTHRSEHRGLRIEGIERHLWNERRQRIERRVRSWCRLKQWYQHHLHPALRVVSAAQRIVQLTNNTLAVSAAPAARRCWRRSAGLRRGRNSAAVYFTGIS
jgi:hypothetical protein